MSDINQIAEKCEQGLPPGYMVTLEFQKFDDGSFECCGNLYDPDGEDVYVDGEGGFIESAIAAAQYDAEKRKVSYDV